MCWPSEAQRPLAIGLLILFEGSTGCVIAALAVDSKLASTTLFFATMGAAIIALLALVGVVAADPGVTTGEGGFGESAQVRDASLQASAEIYWCRGKSVEIAGRCTR